MKSFLRIFLAVAASAFLPAAVAAQSPTKIEFWHAMSGALGERVDELVKKFNASQNKYIVNPVAKGNYDEVVNSMVAAYRAKRQPEIVQINERGFLTMIYSGAIIPAADLMSDKGYKIDWNNFIAPVISYYSKDGKVQAMPFNSSTPILFYNRDHFKAAGFDKPGETWQELEAQMDAIKSKGISKCAMVLPGDYEWSFLENYSAVNDLSYATKRNGIDGLDTSFVFNKHLVGQVERMKRLLDNGVMEIAGQGINAVQLFAAGTCSTIIASTASHAAVEAGAKFAWSAVELPYEKGVTPKNSVIGGGALWALKGHSDEQYQAVAAFFNYLAGVDNQVWWHKSTGYVPVTKAAYETAKSEGYYKTNPTREIAVIQLMRGTPSDNSLGFRMGNSNQINVGIMEEVQAAMLGKKPVQKALDDAVARGNEILRRYEQLHAGKQ
jgi:sn-glycerol 3-phosphate transport system substrate-binding protein